MDENLAITWEDPMLARGALCGGPGPWSSGRDLTVCAVVRTVRGLAARSVR